MEYNKYYLIAMSTQKPSILLNENTILNYCFKINKKQRKDGNFDRCVGLVNRLYPALVQKLEARTKKAEE